MTKINHEEYKALKELDDELKWIARDESGELYVYDEKPIKLEAMWSYAGLYTVWIREHEHLFHFIQWEDEEPHNIAELIEEYEIENGIRYDFGKIKVVDIDTNKLVTHNGYIYVKESEETEMKKDIEWLVQMINEELDILRQRLESGKGTPNQNAFDDGRGCALVHVLRMIQHLDKLEVLSQELPVVPKHVADWIAKHRDTFDLYPMLKRLEKNIKRRELTYKWYRENTHTFVNAYLTGEYEVVEEPLYHALIKGHEVSNFHDIYWNYDKSDDGVFVSRLHPPHDNFINEMSKGDWNKLGINDSNADFVKVEE